MKILLPITILLLFVSCNEEVDPISTVTQQEELTSIEVYAYLCQTIRCDIENPLSGITVELYSSEEDALSKTNPIRSTQSNQDGKAIFINLILGTVYIRIDTEDYGTYIDKELINTNTVKVFHDVRYLKGYGYNENNDNQLRQRHISLSRTAVGQRSTYKYHYTPQSISYSPKEYTNINLNVSVIDQIDSNVFIIKEEIDSIIAPLTNPYYPNEKVIICQWRIENDSLHISPYQDYTYGSYAWNLSDHWFPKEEQGYSFSLNRPTINRIDMNNDVGANDYFWGTGYAEDYTLLDHEYGDLITDMFDFRSSDGPIKLRVYSLDDGLVRSLDFFYGGSLTTHGFDLCLE